MTMVYVVVGCLIFMTIGFIDQQKTIKKQEKELAMQHMAIANIYERIERLEKFNDNHK